MIGEAAARQHFRAAAHESAHAVAATLLGMTVTGVECHDRGGRTFLEPVYTLDEEGARRTAIMICAGAVGERLIASAGPPTGRWEESDGFLLEELAEKWGHPDPAAWLRAARARAVTLLMANISALRKMATRVLLGKTAGASDEPLRSLKPNDAFALPFGGERADALYIAALWPGQPRDERGRFLGGSDPSKGKGKPLPKSAKPKAKPSAKPKPKPPVKTPAKPPAKGKPLPKSAKPPPSAKPLPKSALPKPIAPAPAPTAKVTPRTGTPEAQAEAVHAEVTRIYSHYDGIVRAKQAEIRDIDARQAVAAKEDQRLNGSSPKKLGMTSAEKSKAIHQVQAAYDELSAQRAAAGKAIWAARDAGRAEAARAIVAPEGPARLQGAGELAQDPVVATGRDKLAAMLGKGHPFERVSGGITVERPNELLQGANRAYYLNAHNPHAPGEGKISMPATADHATAAHEYVHGLEYSDPKMLANALAFRDRRTAGETPTVLFGTTHESDHGQEVALADKFDPPYAGKVYSGNRSTEIMTVGVQKALENPGEFAKSDPDYFKFIIGEVRRSHGG